MKLENEIGKNVKCNDALKFLEYLRKSQCTVTKGYQAHGFFSSGTGSIDGEGANVFNRNGCEEVLKKMESVAKECLRGVRK